MIGNCGWFQVYFVIISARSTRSSYEHRRQNIFSKVRAPPAKVRLDSHLVLQSLQFAKVILKTQIA